MSRTRSRLWRSIFPLIVVLGVLFVILDQCITSFTPKKFPSQETLVGVPLYVDFETRKNSGYMEMIIKMKGDKTPVFCCMEVMALIT